jgi:hypothetical protein
MLDRTFDSLQCRQIIGNPYLKERLSRTVLAAAPKPIDPLDALEIGNVEVDVGLLSSLFGDGRLLERK